MLKLDNGIEYTKSQIKRMFGSQLVQIKKHVCSLDKKLIDRWLNEER